MDENTKKNAESPVGVFIPKTILEKRRFERFKANLQIAFGWEDAAGGTPPQEQGFIAPGAFKPGSVEMSDLKRLMTEEVVVGENISTQGVRISMPQPVSEGARLRLRISLPGAPQALDAVGEVRWCRSTGSTWSAGLVFISVGEAERAKMDAFLKERRETQGPDTGADADGEKPSPRGAEKRAFERRRTNLSISYRVMTRDEEKAPAGSPQGTGPDLSGLSDAQLVVSEDISLGGLKINVANPLKEGMRLRLRVAIPGVPISINAIGEVRWCRAVGNLWSAGLMFVALSKADLDKVDRFVALQKRGQMAKRG